MRTFTRFAAAAAAFSLAACTVGCKAPEAITIGGSTRDALTVDDYDIRAGIFIYYELVGVSDAAQQIYELNGTYPEISDIENSLIDGKSADEWIQDKATDYCKQFVAIEREFDKIGGKLSAEDISNIKTAVKSSKDMEVYDKNGIGESSIKDIITNGTGGSWDNAVFYNSKYYYIFNHYYGIDSEYGCTEDELKDYFTDNYARVKYLSISLTDSDGNKLDGDELRELNSLIDDYVAEINAESTDAGKFKKFDEIKNKYSEYTQQKTEEAAKAAEEAAAAEGSGTSTTTTTTTTTTTSTTSDETATTTTTDPYANENILVRYTTTTAPVGETTVVTTTEETDSQKSEHAFNDMVFKELTNYKAERYDYDENTVYIVIRADISERMTEDDLWSTDVINTLLMTRYQQDFDDMIGSLADTYSISKVKKSYKRYAPFKLELE